MKIYYFLIRIVFILDIFLYTLYLKERNLLILIIYITFFNNKWQVAICDIDRFDN